MICLSGKSINVEKLPESTNVSVRTKHDLREPEEILKKLDSMMEKGFKVQIYPIWCTYQVLFRVGQMMDKGFKWSRVWK